MEIGKASLELNDHTQELEEKAQFQPLQTVTEETLINLMAADYSWEQIIYDIIASQGLDPWNLDLAVLASTFLGSIKNTKELDFRIPAKYIIIASTLLKMKSDYLKLVDIPGDAPEETFFDSIEEPVKTNGIHRLEIGNFELMDKRRPVRRIVVTDLINALKRVLKAEERRVVRTATMKEKITIGTENITERINVLYKRIQDVLGSIKEEEVQFSKLVPAWERKHIVDTFLPLVYLHQDKKVYCRQEDFFQEIYVKKSPFLLDQHLTKAKDAEMSCASAQEMNAHLLNRRSRSRVPTHPARHEKERPSGSKKSVEVVSPKKEVQIPKETNIPKRPKIVKTKSKKKLKVKKSKR